MANELGCDYTTGSTLYAVVLNSAQQAWNGSAFETVLAANWATYDIAMTERASTGIYVADLPALSAGSYAVLFYVQAGGTPATTDTCVRMGKLEWNGTEEVALADEVESGVSLKKAIQRIGAVVAGEISGAGTGTEVFLGLDGLTTRVTVVADVDGNRTTVTYS